MHIQAVNQLGTLVFLLFLLLLVSLLVVAFARRLKRRPARSVVLAIVITVAAYGIILLAVSLSSRTQPIAMGTDKCFDDWCATVVSAQALPATNGGGETRLLAVTLRISNQAQRAAFRPSQPRVFLELPSGDTLVPSVAAQHDFESHAGPQEALAKRLSAGESFQTVLVFSVPAATREAFVVVLEGPESVTRFLVGDENSPFHKKIVFAVTAD